MRCVQHLLYLKTADTNGTSFCKKRLRLQDSIILVIKANRMHYFSTLFGKELFMFRTDLLSIIRCFNIVYTAIGIGRTSYVDSLST